MARFAGSELSIDPNEFWNASNLAGDMGMQVGGEQASVTIVPGKDSFRIYEKNDGDPSLYVGDQHNPNESIRTLDTGVGYAYPRESQVGVDLQEMTGRYTDNGNHFAQVDRYIEGPANNPGLSNARYEQRKFNDEARKSFADRVTNDWMKGVNMFDVPRTDFKATYPTMESFGANYGVGITPPVATVQAAPPTPAVIAKPIIPAGL